MGAAADLPAGVAAQCAPGIAEPIDRSYLARFTLGNAALEREILELFAAQLPLYVEQLRAARSWQDWKLTAHTIKGSALAVGARRLADLARAAEHLDGDADPDDAAHRRRQAADAVATAAHEACRHIACLFATG